MIKFKASLEDIFTEGYCSLVLNPVFRRKIESALNSMNWVTDREGLYHKVPEQRSSFANSRCGPVFDYSNFGIDIYPATLIETLRTWIIEQDILGKLSNMYNYKMDFLDIWDGAEDTGWHWDGPEYSDLIFILYFTNEQYWKPEYGGQLDIGKRKLNECDEWMNVLDSNSVHLLDRVLPNNGGAVLINNMNPRFVHKAHKLAASVERRVLTFGPSLEKKPQSDSIVKVS